MQQVSGNRASAAAGRQEQLLQREEWQLKCRTTHISDYVQHGAMIMAVILISSFYTLRVARVVDLAILFRTQLLVKAVADLY